MRMWLRVERVRVFIQIITSLILVTGCSQLPNHLNTKLDKQLLADHQFDDPNYYYIESRNDIFELDNNIAFAIKKKMAQTNSYQKKVNILIEEIVGKPNEDIKYSAAADLTATQAYQNKTANCLSLSIMAYAMAKTANLKVHLQEVKVPELWSDREGNKLANGHVNLKIVATKFSSTTELFSYSKEIDFAPNLDNKRYPRVSLSEAQVQAMFYNNKAASALIAGDLNYAYHYLRQAIELHPNDSPTWSNLGLLYKRKEMVAMAEKAYNQALKLDPTNLTVYDNLAALYTEIGREDKAEEIYASLNKKRYTNPYFHQLKGDLAVEDGDFMLAIKHYKKAIRLNNKVDSFYFNLAQAYYSLGDKSQTKHYLSKAKRYAEFNDMSSQYQAKIDVLNQL